MRAAEGGGFLSAVERLPEDLVNKIAAGEVVERPASVVKELIENAIDAGARSIHVDIEGGGASLVRVRDDGRGMSRTDAELALERHATSKLRKLEDLQAMATHGFRGEALPSIAAVSELVLRTREDGTVEGTEIAVSHGRRLHVRDVGHPRGTTVEVRDLFGAVPARRKFLRAASTEAGHVAEAVTLLALARPETGFFLKSGARRLLEAPPVDGLAPRLFQVFGPRLLEDVVPVEGGADWAVVRGFVSRPDRPRPSRPSLRLYVNRRPVRDRALAKAVSEAYRGSGGGERGFEAFLFVEAPPHLVDVNVHPAKTEVRFADPRTVWAAVERAVKEALSEGVRELPRVEVGRDADDGAVAERAAAATRSFFEHGSGLSGTDPASGWGRRPEAPDRVAEVSASPAPAGAPPIVLGQHRLTYIVASDGDELVLVDQHTAHERVRFERLLERAGRHAVQSQGLVTPLVLELPPELRPVLDAQAETLGELGFDVEAFGGGSTRLRALPAVLGHKDPGPALEGILRDLAQRGEAEWAVAGTRDRLAATLACHSAVRAGQPLNVESMSAIVRDLLQTAHPTLCPHGRPTVVRIPRTEVSRWFGRTGWRRQ
ncbi:MAG: DNA mismatch repair endonuclease MutL [Acidobacteriota bacterium]